MYDLTLEQVQSHLDYLMREQRIYQKLNHKLTGRYYMPAGPLLAGAQKLECIDTRDRVSINYIETEGQRPYSPEWSAEIEFEGEGEGGKAVAEYLNRRGDLHGDLIDAYEQGCGEDIVERISDHADWVYEQAKDRRLGQ